MSANSIEQLERTVLVYQRKTQGLADDLQAANDRVRVLTDALEAVVKDGKSSFDVVLAVNAALSATAPTTEQKV